MTSYDVAACMGLLPGVVSCSLFGGQPVYLGIGSCYV